MSVAVAAIAMAGMTGAPTPAAAAGAQSAEAAQRHGAVTIRRDQYGTPTISADDTYSLYYGYGYALAEDRLFQIESVRRALIGRSAEVFGPEYLDRDIATLTNFDPERLRPQIAALTGEHREVLQGMTAGINARISEVLANRETLMPRQFIDYEFEPATWTEFDIVSAFTSLLLIGFADNSRQTANLTFLSELIDRHGEENGSRIFDALRWEHDPSSPTTVQREDQEAGRAVSGGPANRPRNRDQRWPALLSDAGAQEQQLELSMALWGGDGIEHVPLASNAWVVNGERLADADALMVGGPQVGDAVPSMIWAASLRGAGLNVTGMTYPGLPYFHFGTNGDISWTRTALAGSVVDIFQVELHPQDSHRYRHNGRWLDMERRTVEIPVRGEAARSVDFYRTVHGPVLVFDEEDRRAYAKRRTWEDHVVQTMFAYYEEMKATNFDEWSAAIYRKANNQSQYYADRHGNIGYIQAGRYPIRHPDHNIMLPTPGDGSMEWEGIQSPEENARVLNPAQGYIVNWNNPPSPDILNSDSRLWSRMDHVDGLIEQFESRPSHTAQQLWDFNRYGSHIIEQHRYFVPYVAEAVRDEPADSRIRRLGEAITRWDGLEVDPTGTGVLSSPGSAVYHEWLEQALTLMFERDLPEAYVAGCGSFSSYNCPNGQSFGANFLYFLLADGEGGSPRLGYDFLHGETPMNLVRQALARADAELTEQFGTDEVSRWLSPLRPKRWRPMNPRGLPWAGQNEGFTFTPDQRRGTMNALFVFRNGEVSMCDAVPPGQSGFIAPDGTPDPNYDSQFQIYTSFSCRPRPITEDEIVASTVSERRLEF